MKRRDAGQVITTEQRGLVMKLVFSRCFPGVFEWMMHRPLREQVVEQVRRRVDDALVASVERRRS